MDPEFDLDPLAPQQRGFFRKLSVWLRPWKKPKEEVTEEMYYPADDTDGNSDASGSELAAWPKRRASKVTRLEEGFDRLVRLVDTIDEHIRTQAERSEQMVAQTRRIADAIAQSQGLDRQRTEAVDEMATQFKNQVRQMQQVAEAVESLPRAIKNQTEQLGQVRDQLEAQLEAQLSSAQGIQQLAGAAEGMRNASESQRRHFEKMHDANQAANLQIVSALDRQGRRFTWLMAFMLGLSLMAAVAAVIAIILTIRK